MLGRDIAVAVVVVVVAVHVVGVVHPVVGVDVAIFEHVAPVAGENSSWWPRQPQISCDKALCV